MHRQNDTILAIDPGLRELGYAVIAGKSLKASGVLALRNVPPSRRLGKIRERLEDWVRAYHPRTLVIEHIPKRPLDSLGGLPALGRLLERFAKAQRLRVAAYSAKTVRRSVVGNGWAGKRAVAEALSARYPELRVHLTQNRKWKDLYWQNMYDALALAIHHQLMAKPPSRSRSSG